MSSHPSSLLSDKKELVFSLVSVLSVNAVARLGSMSDRQQTCCVADGPVGPAGSRGEVTRWGPADRHSGSLWTQHLSRPRTIGQRGCGRAGDGLGMLCKLLWFVL